MWSYSDMAGPKAFIVGAPKCGTSALALYLSEHPMILFSRPKEPGYFCTDLTPLTPFNTRVAYERLFRTKDKRKTCFMEGSVWYLYSRIALQAIKRYRPAAKIIVMIRNPVEMVHSLHAQYVYEFYEDTHDFESAWRKEPARRRGEPVRSRVSIPPELRYYSRIGRLGDQMEKLLDLFENKQVHVVRFDDLLRHPQQTYVDVLEFLNLPYDGRTRFQKANAGKAPPKGVMRYLTHPPESVLKAATKTKHALGIGSLGILKRLRLATAKYEPRMPLRGGFRDELVEEFRSDVRKLASLTHIDLDSWLN
jgi:hypothetical protein